jgi:hypothetical protein
MFRRFTVTLSRAAAERLQDVAREERRDPREQAAIIVERVLARRRGGTGRRGSADEPRAVER